MKRFARIVTRSLLAAGVVGALGFGATQALASTADASAPARQTCTYRCTEDCWRMGYDTGGCDNYNRCICWNYP